MTQHSTINAIQRGLVPALAAAALAMTAGCLEIGDDLPDDFSICEDTSDCGAGESCDDGVCWGNPPDRTFAAMILPPTEEADFLAPTEIPMLDIAPDGTITNLQFAEPVIISGRIVVDCSTELPEMCDPMASVDAQLVIRRSSALPGEPHYVRLATSAPGVPPGEPSFSVALPMSTEPYEVTVVPEARPTRRDETVTPHASLAPPTTFTVTADVDKFEQWVIGRAEDYRIVSGRIINNLDGGVEGMRVSVPKRTPGQVVSRLSSEITTDSNGAFALRVPKELTLIELSALPDRPGTAPALRRKMIQLPAGDEPYVLPEPLVMPPFGDTQSYTIEVTGIDNNGDTARISGADVKVTTELDSEISGDLTAKFSTLATTGDDGKTTINLIPGNVFENRRYTINVEPPEGSEHQAIYGFPIEVGVGGNLLIELPSRIGIGGELRRNNGELAEGTTVTAGFSRNFRGRLAALDPLLDGFAEALRLASETSANGRFLLWLDRALVQVDPKQELSPGDMASYDLTLVPENPLGAQWTLHGLDMRDYTDEGGIELGDVYVPEAAYARGTIVRPNGSPIGNARLRLFEIVEHESFCDSEDTGEACTRAVERGAWTSDSEDGEVMAILPDPDRAPRPSARDDDDD